MHTWEHTARPYDDQLEVTRRQFDGQAAELEQAQQAREDFLAEHPDVPRRLAELDREIRHQQKLERRRSFEPVLRSGPQVARRHQEAPRFGISHERDTGRGIDL